MRLGKKGCAEAEKHIGEMSELEPGTVTQAGVEEREEGRMRSSRMDISRMMSSVGEN